MANIVGAKRTRRKLSCSAMLLVVVTMLFVAVLLVMLLLHFSAKLRAYVFYMMRPHNICQYAIPMRYDFDTFVENFSTKNTLLIDSLRRLPWANGNLTEDDLNLVALFKTACSIAGVYPRRACGSRVMLHPYCSAELTSLDISDIRKWMTLQKHVFVPIIRDDLIVLPINLVWIEHLPEPFRSYAGAGAINAELLICKEGLTFEMAVFDTLKERVTLKNGDMTTPTGWFPGKAEELYWAFRLHSCCLKEGVTPVENSDLRYFGRLASFVQYLRHIAESNS